MATAEGTYLMGAVTNSRVLHEGFPVEKAETKC